MTKSNGYLLHETQDIVVIATGFKRKSDNPKTGDMIQIWILARDVNPVEAIKIGADEKVCFDCKHRGVAGKQRTCYVRIANAPLGVWKAYTRGMYRRLELADYERAFAGRKVRFGAYGDPVLIPVAMVAAIAGGQADGLDTLTNGATKPMRLTARSSWHRVTLRRNTAQRS